jgi:integrase
MQKLSVKFLEAAKPTTKKQIINDTVASGLRIIIHPSGRKVWAWCGSSGGKLQTLTLGAYPAHSLDAARRWAEGIVERRDGGLPLLDQPEAAAPEPEPAPEPVKSHRTVDWLFELYMEHEGAARRTSKEKRQIYEREIRPAIGDKVLEDVTYADLAALVRAKAKIAPGASNNLQVQIKRMFRWAVTHGRDLTGLEVDVARDLVKMAPINSRARHFSDYEIGVFLKAIEQCPTQINEGLLLCLYTGVRRSEAFDATWDEFDLEKGVWVIPPERVKNNTEHVLPLPQEMIDLLTARREVTGDKTFVWPSVYTAKRDEPSAIDQFSKPRARLAEKMTEIAAKDNKTIDHWTIHDIRRTVSSGMNALLDEDDIPVITPDTVERVVNHKIGGVAGVYNRFQYFAPKKKALRLWADHLATLKPAVPASTG